MQESIKKLIREALKELGVVADSVHIEHPEAKEHGDYSTNAAFLYSKKLDKSPRVAAELITELIQQQKNDFIEKIEVAGSGFINFHLSRGFFVRELKAILGDKENYGKNKELSGKKIIIEYTDPNPFKEFHIGHLMSNAIGESLSRLLEYSGAEVKRANYQGDVGLHVAKAIWGKKKKPELSWGNAYVYGSENYEDNKEEVNELNKKIYERPDKEINNIYENGKKMSLDYFEEIYRKLDTKFDFYFFESETGPLGKEIVEKNIGTIFEKSDGAVIFRGEDEGLLTRVFITSEGLPTYEAKELGLAKIKNDKYPYDISFVVTGNEVKDYFKVVCKAMERVYPELAKKTKHITHGMLRLPSGKMSSRTGDVITAESLIKEAKDKIIEKMKDSDIPNKDKVAEEIAIGAIKYSILKHSPGGDIIFDFDTSLSFEGSSGPYLQYTYARAKSVLEKAEERGIVASLSDTPPEEGETSPVSDGMRDLSAGTNGVERMLYQFPEIVSRAREEKAPQYIATYLTDLAQAFNNFYAKERIVDADKYAPYRVAITTAVSITLKNGLYLLGIKAPEKM